VVKEACQMKLVRLSRNDGGIRRFRRKRSDDT
jgi:hypothetical protein